MRINKIPHSLPSLWKTPVFLVIATVLGAVFCVTLFHWLEAPQPLQPRRFRVICHSPKP